MWTISQEGHNKTELLKKELTRLPYRCEGQALLVPCEAHIRVLIMCMRPTNSNQHQQSGDGAAKSGPVCQRQFRRHQC